jgi:hypothetical protein
MMQCGILNDTGSNAMTVIPSDLTAMQIPDDHFSWLPDVTVRTANGRVTRRSLLIEIQLRKVDSNEASSWFRETATVDPPQRSEHRLSGAEMRRRFYFATAPGHNRLFVSMTKGGLTGALP